MSIFRDIVMRYLDFNTLKKALRAYPNSFTARWPIIIAVFASELGAESQLAMVIRPNGWRPIRVESPGPPFE